MAVACHAYVITNLNPQPDMLDHESLVPRHALVQAGDARIRQGQLAEVERLEVQLPLATNDGVTGASVLLQVLASACFVGKDVEYLEPKLWRQIVPGSHDDVLNV